MDLNKVRAVLLDIEGTICPFSFISDVLFPYALRQLPGVLPEKWDDPAFMQYREAFPLQAQASPEALKAHVRDLMAKNEKVASLKKLQGYLWEAGYKSGDITAPLFPDVIPQLETWDSDGIRLAIFSSGSVSAQKLLLQHVLVEGDGTTPESSEPKTDSVDNEQHNVSLPMKRKHGLSGSPGRPQKMFKTDAGAKGENGVTNLNNVSAELENGGKAIDGEEHKGEKEEKNKAEVHQEEEEQEVEDKGEREEGPAGSSFSTTDQTIHFFNDPYFDTVNAGPKTEKESYVKIATKLGFGCEEILFLSDNVQEIRAALAAEMRAILVSRPGNPPLSDDETADLRIISSLEEVGPLHPSSQLELPQPSRPELHLPTQPVPHMPSLGLGLGVGLGSFTADGDFTENAFNFGDYLADHP